MIILDSKPCLVVDRRKFLGAAAGLIAAGLLPKSVLALAAPYSFKQGAVDVTVVSDGHLVLPTGVFGPDAPPEALKAILTAAGATGNEVQVPANVTLIKSGADLNPDGPKAHHALTLNPDHTVGGSPGGLAWISKAN